MADRDALIVICWLVILILVFFECFHRKLKARFGREIQPPSNHRQSLTSFPSDAATLGASSSLSNGHFGGSFRRADLLPSTLSSAMSFNRGARFSGPIAITTSISASTDDVACGNTKEVCRIPMMSMMMMSYDSVEEEEPPPTYEEAISYAKLVSKFQSPIASPSPSYHQDASVILQCDDADSAHSDGSGTESINVRANQSKHADASSSSGGGADNNATNNGIPTTLANRTTTTTTAIFISEEEDESEIDSEETDDDDDEDSVESANNSAGDEDVEPSQVDIDLKNNNDEDNESTSESQRISKNNVVNSQQEPCSEEVQCNKNVIVLGSASSTSTKDVHRIGVDCPHVKRKLRCSKSTGNYNGEKAELLGSPLPPKLIPPPPSAENLV